MDNECPICQKPAQFAPGGLKTPEAATSYAVSCERCGEYLISMVAVAASDLVPNEKRHILSGIVRNRFEQKIPTHISTENVQALLDSVSEPSPSEQIDLLLKHLRRKQPDRNNYVRLNLRTDYPILYAKNGPDFQYLVDKARDESRYIERNTAANLANHYRLSLEGWNRLAELDRPAEQEPSREIELEEVVPGALFISYSRQDQTYARNLADDLRKGGFDVWIDDRIDYGDRWWQTIVEAIRACAAFIVVMTPDSEESEWVEREVHLALREQKPIFPLLLRGETFPLLITKQYVDIANGLMPPQSFHHRLRQVLRAVDAAGGRDR